MSDNNVKAETKVLLVVVFLILGILLFKTFYKKESFLDLFFGDNKCSHTGPTPTPPLKFTNYKNVNYPYDSYLNNAKVWPINEYKLDNPNNVMRQPYQSPPLTTCNTDNDCTAAEKCDNNICTSNTPLKNPKVQNEIAQLYNIPVVNDIIAAEATNDNDIYHDDSLACPIIMQKPK